MTIKDLARICGVSISTVSRVLNDRPDVSEDVRRRVLEAIRESGYVPNSAARDLVSRGSDAIGVVIRGSENHFFSAVLRSITSELDRRGQNMVPRFIGAFDDEVKAGAILEREKRLQGLIFLGGRFDYTPSELSLVGVPYVCCAFTNYFGSLDVSKYSSVSIDDTETARQAMEYLYSMGHRRIAILTPSRTDRSISELRFRGYCEALESHGIPFDESLVAEVGSYDMAAAYQGACRLLERGGDFTALFAPSDTTALAAIRALEDRRLRVPEDVSVMGVDGMELSLYTDPVLTTMIQPAAEMGRRCVELLLDTLEKSAPTRHIRLHTAVREGASVRRIEG